MDKYQPLPHLIESIYVGQKRIAQRGVYWPRTNGDVPARTPGNTFFCPKCNDIWARRVVSSTDPNFDTKDYLDPVVVLRRCERHGDGSTVISEFEWSHMLDPRFEGHYPLEWMAYELFLIVRRYP